MLCSLFSLSLKWQYGISFFNWIKRKCLCLISSGNTITSNSFSSKNQDGYHVVFLCKCALSTLKKEIKVTHLSMFLPWCVQQKKSIHGDIQTSSFHFFLKQTTWPHTRFHLLENSATVGIRTRVLWKNCCLSGHRWSFWPCSNLTGTVFFPLIYTCNIPNNKNCKQKSQWEFALCGSKPNFFPSEPQGVGKIYRLPYNWLSLYF